MAAHRKPRQRSLGGTTARTAATIALAGAASAAAFDGTGHADPRLSPAQVRTQVDTLYQQAEAATERYDGAKEQADKARTRLSALQDEAARRTERLDTARQALGHAAAAQYRDGGIDPSVRLLLSTDPGHYLDDAAFTERADDRQAAAVADVRAQLREIERLRGAARAETATLTARQAELRRQQQTINKKLGQARELLSRLTRAQQARIAKDSTGGTDRASRDTRRDAGPASAAGPVSVAAPTAQAPGSRAAEAVAYAYAKLGSPYVWGATGPHSFDCSGLVQAAYRAAGISLPRTTYSQIDAGRRVSRAELRPGDLVFFYSGVSHVGIYVGNGRMIHAPNPSAPVRLAPIDQMPFAGATRVA
ncbi:NlpC/P60 family protein [Streptomyces sp. NPDC048664]|uniref:C40 family peptidase n=1 Tax=Streptomyces sp. NPDC048664 TaxID=3154505 RepID=UPI0034295CB4